VGEQVVLDDHSHDVTATADGRHLRIALGLLVVFMVVEVVVSLISHSLALLADAGHMLTDVGAIGGSLWAMHLAEQPASPVWSYGLKRAEILAAAVNGGVLLVVAILIGAETIRRLVHPHLVDAVPMLAVAMAGVVVNLVATWVLARAERRSLNLEGAFQHILTDLYAYVATVGAAVVILVASWQRADAVASLLVVVLMLRAAWRLLKAAGHILLEGTPEAVDLDDVRRHLHGFPEVIAVHDLHAWTLTSALPALTAHVVVTDRCLRDGSAGRLLDRLQECLSDHFDVEHSVFQIEPASHSEHERGTHA
jgi:cobalt-zinc-cadmium efflux system protein